MTFAEKKALYESKFISLDEALGMIHSGDTIAQAAYGNEPLAMLRNLHTSPIVASRTCASGWVHLRRSIPSSLIPTTIWTA